jgi:hypothetical protein
MNRREIALAFLTLLCAACTTDRTSGTGPAGLAVLAAHAAQTVPSDEQHEGEPTIEHKPGHERARKVTYETENGKQRVYRSLTRDEDHYKFPWDDPNFANQKKVRQPPLPHIVISNGWLYINGDAPCVGTTAVVAQSTSTRLLLYYVPNEGQATSCRICYLEGGAKNEVHVWHRPGGNENTLVPRYHYVEANLNADGSFHSWNHADANKNPVPRSINDSLSTDGTHSTVMNQVSGVMEEEGWRTSNSSD